jgi:glycine cleavage system H lipoate-binding protein
VLDTLLYALVFVLGLLARLLALVLVVAVFAIPIYFVARAVGLAERASRRRLGLVEDHGLSLSLARSYATTHTWLSKGLLGRLTVGLDGLADWLLPDLTAVQLPQPGAHLVKGEPAITLRSHGRDVTLPAPMDGFVTSVNGELATHPQVVHEDPYGRGWLFRMKPEGKLPELPTGETAREWFHAEKRRLATLLEPELGLTAADGGELVLGTPPPLPEGRWREAVDAFLR